MLRNLRWKEKTMKKQQKMEYEEMRLENLQRLGQVKSDMLWKKTKVRAMAPARSENRGQAGLFIVCSISFLTEHRVAIRDIFYLDRNLAKHRIYSAPLRTL